GPLVEVLEGEPVPLERLGEPGARGLPLREPGEESRGEAVELLGGDRGEVLGADELGESLEILPKRRKRGLLLAGLGDLVLRLVCEVEEDAARLAEELLGGGVDVERRRYRLAGGGLGYSSPCGFGDESLPSTIRTLSPILYPTNRSLRFAICSEIDVKGNTAED